MSKSKRFIDKKKSVTFQLVHRSQQDPLIADDSAPQHVLLPINETEQRIDEQQKYGIYYTDDTNYLQHLKNTSDNQVEWPEHVDDTLEQRKINLPSSVFASRVEDAEGMLSKAAPVSGPQLHLDPDLVAAMDEDFNFDDPCNELEDDFIQLADGLASDEESYYDEEGDEVGSELSFEKEETKSRFTSYSMSSSVIRRNEQLSLLDERFEKMYEGYDENEIGALDCEEIEGFVEDGSDLLKQCIEEFESGKMNEKLDKAAILDHVIYESDEDDDVELVEIEPKNRWDCESILSTYSNIYNHPKLIKESSNKIAIHKKTGIPLNVLDANKLTKRALDQFNETNEGYESFGPKTHKSVISQLSMLSIRPKNETNEERKVRKHALKEYKKERRLEKKANSLAFKEEAKRQIKIAINKQNNVQGNKIL